MEIPHITRQEDNNLTMIIPECCRLVMESNPSERNYQKILDNCPHVSKKIREKKRNIGL